MDSREGCFPLEVGFIIHLDCCLFVVLVAVMRSLDRANGSSVGTEYEGARRKKTGRIRVENKYSEINLSLNSAI